MLFSRPPLLGEDFERDVAVLAEMEREGLFDGLLDGVRVAVRRNVVPAGVTTIGGARLAPGVLGDALAVLNGLGGFALQNVHLVVGGSGRGCWG